MHRGLCRLRVYVMQAPVHAPRTQEQDRHRHERLEVEKHHREQAKCANSDGKTVHTFTVKPPRRSETGHRHASFAQLRALNQLHLTRVKANRPNRGAR